MVDAGSSDGEPSPGSGSGSRKRRRRERRIVLWVVVVTTLGVCAVLYLSGATGPGLTVLVAVAFLAVLVPTVLASTSDDPDTRAGCGCLGAALELLAGILSVFSIFS